MSWHLKHSPVAVCPDESDPGLPHAAAVCVYPAFIGLAREQLAGTGVKVAAVATGFPSGQYPLEIRLADTRAAVEAGADEIDMVINRGAFLAGRRDEVADEIRLVKAACGRAHLKVILETGELETYDLVRAASRLTARVMLEANGKHANARSILGVLALGAAGGAEIRISASGPGAGDAASAIAGVIANLGR